MSKKLALLICANPKTLKEGHSVYVPAGEWEIDFREVKDSVITLELVSHLSTGRHYNELSIENNRFRSEGRCYRARFIFAGTENNITLAINQCL